MTLPELDPASVALVRLAAAVALGKAKPLTAASRKCRRAGVPPVWVDELLLQSVLMVGWPRALVGFTSWRELGSPRPQSIEDGTDYRDAPTWEARGTAVCREIYGDNYDQLRQNIRALHPTLETWMVTDGYGKCIGRPGLDLARRELCVVAQTAVLGTERQLHSHLRGALNAGAAAAAIDQTFGAIRVFLGKRERELAAKLWQRIRP